MEQRKEITIIHENRDGKKILSTGTPIFDPDGQMTKIITTSRDITELTSLQKQLEFVQNTLKQFESIETSSSEPIIASSRSMRNVMQLALRLASVDSTIYYCKLWRNS